MTILRKENKIKNYKDLIAWKKAYQLCLLIYKTTEKFPTNELYGITSQIKRSALSVPSNIAEGFSRHQTKEYIRFLYISFSSLAELETQILIAKDLKFIGEEKYLEINLLFQELQKIISGLIQSLKRFQNFNNNQDTSYNA